MRWVFKTLVFIIGVSLLSSSCKKNDEAVLPKSSEINNVSKPNPVEEEPAKVPEQPQPELPLPTRFLVSGKLSANAMNVLTAAFATDYPQGEDSVNAYDFPLYNGTKGMDWWNFPWDLGSRKMEYTITYDDMKDMLMHVKVRKTKQSPDFVRYGEKLAEMVDELTSTIMNEHGGYQRVVKIIYCVRNFLAVAKKYQLSEDIPPLKRAAAHLIKIYKSNELLKGPPEYYVTSDMYQPKNVDGLAEDRTSANGIGELENLLK